MKLFKNNKKTKKSKENKIEVVLKMKTKNCNIQKTAQIKEIMTIMNTMILQLKTIKLTLITKTFPKRKETELFQSEKKMIFYPKIKDEIKIDCTKKKIYTETIKTEMMETSATMIISNRKTMKQIQTIAKKFLSHKI